MQKMIEGKIQQWQAGMAQLQQKREQLLAELERTNAQIQLNQGAIMGAEELLAEVAPPGDGTETPEDSGTVGL